MQQVAGKIDENIFQWGSHRILKLVAKNVKKNKILVSIQ